MMKGISIREPFATFITHGVKDLEIRGNKSTAVIHTKHRGDLLICASSSMHHLYSKYKRWCGYSGDPVFDQSFNEFQRMLLLEDSILFEPSPPSHIIGVVHLGQIIPFTQQLVHRACCSYDPETSALVLSEPRRTKPIALAGRTSGMHLGIFNVKIDPSELIFI